MPSPPIQDRLVIAGATGALGNEVMRLLVGMQAWREVDVLAREPMRTGLRGVHARVVEGDDPVRWPTSNADTAVVMFDPPRLFYQRERALWTPRPEQLPALARWLRASDVRTLAVVMPHTQMRLPDALKRGLASLDEHAISRLHFDRLLIVRTVQKPGEESGGHLLVQLARFMLAAGRSMVPSSEQPVRAAKVAQYLAHALELAPRGIHVAASETVWQAAQGDVRAAVTRWLQP
jgi:hypothetical protein